ncbi:putative ribonuclease H-like domain-containing protein [Tanacetum coccineum]
MGAYDDDEDVGAVADFNNMDNTIAASPIPTLRIHKDYPKGQILRDPTSAVQTRGKIQKASSAQQALNQELYHKHSTRWESWVEANAMKNCFSSNYEGLGYCYCHMEKDRGVMIMMAGFCPPVARIEAIMLFLAFASYMGFTIYQMDVKSEFLYDTIEEEVYVHQPPGFVDPAHPNKVYKVIKALYGLHQAPRACYETLSSFLMENGFRRGTIDKTLFIKKKKSDIMLVQVYMDDIIFGSTKKSMCTEFEECMHKRFQMSSMGELTFFLRHQVKQQPDGIFISQDKSMIGSLMYLNASRPDIMFVVCTCARFQVTPKALRLNAVKRIFRYLKHQPKLGGCQFLGRRLISWQCKKQTIVANSTTEAEYVAAANCCGQVLWIQNQMMDYGFNFMNTKIHIDNESTISVIKNPVAHSRTKHIEIRFHFIRDCYEKRLIEVIKIHTDSNVADLLTKGFDVTRFNFLVVSIGMLNLISMDLRMDRSCAANSTHIWSVSTKYALTHNPTIYDSLVKQFWQTAIVRTLDNGTQQLVASIDSKEYSFTVTSVRSAVVDQGKGSTQPTEPHHTLVDPLPSTSQPHIPSPAHKSPPHSPPHPTPHSPPYLTPHSPPHSTPHYSPTRSYEAPLLEGNTLGSAKDSVQLKELIVLVPKLVNRIGSLEKELKETLGNAVLTLVKKFLGKRILKEKLVDCVTPKQNASGDLKRREIRPHAWRLPKFVKDVEDEINTGRVEINSGIEDVNTGSSKVDTGRTSISTSSIIHSPKRGQREGKAQMVKEDIQATHKIKEQIRQEEARLEEAIRLQAQMDEEVAKQIHLDKMAKLEANTEVVKSLQEESISNDDFAKRMVEMINKKKKLYAKQKAKAKRKSWKLSQLKKLSFEELKTEFEKLMKSIESFVPLETEAIGKDKVVKEEETEVPVKKIGMGRKQKARKGINIDKTAQDEFNKKREAYVKDKVKDASSESEIRVDVIPTAI